MKIKMYMLKFLNFVHTLAFLSLSLWLKMSFIKSSSWRSILVFGPSDLPPILVSRADTESNIDIDMYFLKIYFWDFGSACVYLFWTMCRVLCLSKKKNGHFKSIGVHVCFCNVVIKYIQIKKIISNYFLASEKIVRNFQGQHHSYWI